MKRPRVIKEEEEEAEDTDNGLHSSSPPAVKSSIKSEELKCELCDTVCSSISQLQSHTLSEHIPKRKTSSGGAVTPVQRISCQQCADTFENFPQFAIHMKSHLSATNSVFYCPVCPMGAQFRDKKSQLEHITLQHVQVQLTQYVCTHCDAICATNTALASHFADTHRKFLCANCEYTTDNEKAFKEHAKVHSRQIVMYGCSLCGQAWPTPQSLVNHVQMAHDQQETFYHPNLLAAKSSSPSPKPSKPRVLQCSVCDEQVLGEDGLDDHRLRMHCKVRFADKCADCQAPIKTETSFVDHCLRHAKDHNHHCPVCRQSLRSDAQIHAHCVYHMRKPESEMKEEEDFQEDREDFNFTCPICGEKFDDPIAVMQHTQDHQN
ncbi:unnamed protein product [Caenorhabditis sp. 36 PRJEB53466]|nr:unnamed protein product [Caenorhabditis sp. 36 PRJEB53466]